MSVRECTRLVLHMLAIKIFRETEDGPVNHSEGLAFKQCERSLSLSFYQVLIEQRDQIAEYRNESRKRARHAIFYPLRSRC